jgi:uncharacterized membrane protein YesL|tara:strand:+ start:476 stop:775 length:300 start_codon:yes stop_codon:yes gene_type:complete
MYLENIKNNLTSIFGIMLGITLFFIICALFSIVFCGSGYFLLKKYNKKNTKLFKEIQTPQYFGLVLIIIGIVPYLDTIIRGLFFNIGANVGQYISEELF